MATIYVSTSGNDSSGNGSENNPYRTIQEGINRASGGDTVYVKSGIYYLTGKYVYPYPAIRIQNKPKLILKGENKNSIIDGSKMTLGSAYPSTWELGLVIIKSSGVKMDGFTVQNSKVAGIVTSYNPNITITNNKVYRTWASGIIVHAVKGLTVKYNEVAYANNPPSKEARNYKGSQESISIAGGGHNTTTFVDNFEIAYNYLHDSGYDQNGVPITSPTEGGMYLKHNVSNGRVHHNHVKNCAATGIYVDGQETGSMTKNINVYRNLVESSGGVFVSTEANGSCYDTTIDRNVLWKNNGPGIGTPNTSSIGIITNLIIKNNIAYKNGSPTQKQPGIWLGRPSRPEWKLPTYTNIQLINNVLSQNAGGGMIIDPRVGPEITQNTGNITPGSSYDSRADCEYRKIYNEIHGGSIIICGGESAIKVTSPNGGENWIQGSTQTIAWTNTGSPGSYVKIELYKSGILNRTITNSVSNTGSYNWTIPSWQTIGTDYTIKVTTMPDVEFIDNASYTDTSNSTFIISSAISITVLSPNGGENWVHGSQESITWESANIPSTENVDIKIFQGSIQRAHWTRPNDGIFYLTVTAGTYPVGTDYTVRITGTGNYASIVDSSDTTFTIRQ